MVNGNRRAAGRASLAEELLGATVAANLRMTERIVGRFVALMDESTPRVDGRARSFVRGAKKVGK